MKLIMDSLRFVDILGIEEGLKVIAEAGFDGVDVSLFPYGETAERHFLYRDDYMDAARRFKDCLERFGLSHEQSHAPFTLRYGMPEDESCREYRIMMRAMEVAAYLGCRHIVVHGLTLPAGATPEENVDWNTAFYERIGARAAGYGIKVAVENISGSCTTPEMHAEVMRRLDPEHFVCLVDVGHALCRAGLQPGEYLRKMPRGLVKGLHVHDTTRTADLHHLPYLDEIDFADLMKALAETGYEGDLTFEVQKFCKPYIEQGLAKPCLDLCLAVGKKLLAEYEAAKA